MLATRKASDKSNNKIRSNNSNEQANGGDDSNNKALTRALNK